MIKRRALQILSSVSHKWREKIKSLVDKTWIETHDTIFINQCQRLKCKYIFIQKIQIFGRKLYIQISITAFMWSSILFGKWLYIKWRYKPSQVSNGYDFSCVITPSYPNYKYYMASIAFYRKAIQSVSTPLEYKIANKHFLIHNNNFESLLFIFI